MDYDGDQDHLYAVHIETERAEGFHHLDIYKDPQGHKVDIHATSHLAKLLNEQEGGEAITIEIVERDENTITPMSETILQGTITDTSNSTDGSMIFEINPESLTVDDQVVV